MMSKITYYIYLKKVSKNFNNFVVVVLLSHVEARSSQHVHQSSESEP